MWLLFCAANNETIPCCILAMSSFGTMVESPEHSCSASDCWRTTLLPPASRAPTEINAADAVFAESPTAGNATRHGNGALACEHYRQTWYEVMVGRRGEVEAIVCGTAALQMGQPCIQ